MAADTGTYMSAVFALFPPDSADCYITEEFPNYRYVGGEIELLGDSIPEWSRHVTAAHAQYTGTAKTRGWCDENSQFKQELQNYNIVLRGNRRKLELRVEITREYFQNRHVWLAPWLSILPYELEHATWPDDTSSAGRFERVKDSDHTLDCLEHILSRRPRHASMIRERTKPFLQREFEAASAWRAALPRGDTHLGPLG